MEEGKKYMKVASFNVNSIRARLEILLGWLEREGPDLVCLQETKTTDDKFPLQEVEGAGYTAGFSGEKTYNGVAIISKTPLGEVKKGFNEEGLGSTRLIASKVRGVNVVNTYAPQGFKPGSEKFAEKLEWYVLLHDYFDRNFSPEDRIIWLGDFNIAPDPRDVYDPEGLWGQVGYHPDEHTVLDRIREWGFVDVFRLHNNDAGQYTFWDYRVRGAVKNGIGWRVDHIWATKSIAERSVSSWIDISPRLLEKPSDHTPILAEFDI